MTQLSSFWDGTTTGDAAASPYSAQEFAAVLSILLGSDAGAVGYVVPHYLNNLTVQASSPAAASVDVLSGGALVKGFTYTNSAPETIAISANASGNPRIDRVVLRADYAAQTVRLVLLVGTPAASPSIPSLTQIAGTTWETPLAYIWVANGFATIADADIHDERVFFSTGEAARLSSYHNMIRGSEFIPKYSLQGSLGNIAVAGTWTATNGPGVNPTITFVTKPAQQTRGNAVQLVSVASGKLSQVIKVQASTTYTLRTLVQTNTAGSLSVDVYSYAAAAVLISRTIRVVGSFVEEILRFTTDAAETHILLRFSYTHPVTVQIGQPTLVAGLLPAPFEPVHEFIPFKGSILDGSWQFTAKSSGATLFNLSTTAWGILGAFNSPDEVLAIHCIIGANDSGSAAAANDTAALRVSSYPLSNDAPNVGSPNQGIYLDLGGEVNDRRKYASGFVNPQVRTNSGGDLLTLANQQIEIYIGVAATGASTLDAYVGITGINT